MKEMVQVTAFSSSFCNFSSLSLMVAVVASMNSVLYEIFRRRMACT